MKLRRLLVANRGEIALRVLRAASELNVSTVALSTPDDVSALHTASASKCIEVNSYLNSSAIVEAALARDCDAIHPGYGFLSESVDFAKRCEDANIT